MTGPSPAWPEPRSRSFGLVNFRGSTMLLRRETLRALKVWDFTIAAATIRAVLFAAVFGFATAGVDRMMGGLSLIDFLIPGLIAAAVLENAFVAAAFSLVHDRIEGILVDILVAPLALAEVLAVYVVSALTSSLVVGALVWLVLLPFGAPLPRDVGALVGFAAGGAVFVGFISAMVGLWVQRWDSLAAVQTFIVLPFVFTSGVFFSLDRLPAGLAALARVNPLLYVVDGIRYGLTGVAETDLATGLVVVAVAIGLAGTLCGALFAAGRGLRD